VLSIRENGSEVTAPAGVAVPTARVPDAATQMLLRVSTGYIVSAALNVAIELQLADRLAAGPKTVAELAEQTGSCANVLYCVLRPLACVGVLKEVSPRRFALNPLGTLLCHTTSSGVREVVRWLTDPVHLRVFAEIGHAVKSGAPVAERALGDPWFVAVDRDRHLSEVFDDAMSGESVRVAGSILAAYDFSDTRLIVDVGGGQGVMLASILGRNAETQGVLFDMPNVVAGGARLLEEAGVANRCRCVAGDFFAEAPTGGDIYLLKNILHDWPDERAVAILRRIRSAIGEREGVRVLVLETIAGETSGPDYTAFMDLVMCLLLGGRERTADEFRALFDQAGFELARVIHTGSSVSIIEAGTRSITLADAPSR
jgi:hypothetical protein